MWKYGQISHTGSEDILFKVALFVLNYWGLIIKLKLLDTISSLLKFLGKAHKNGHQQGNLAAVW